MDGIALLTIFILSVFVGFEVVSKVSTVLHTPLMSGANAVSGITVVGAVALAGSASSAAVTATNATRAARSGTGSSSWWP